MARSPAHMTDAELEAALQPQPWEDRLECVGCGMSAVVWIVCTWEGYHRLQGSFVTALLVGLFWAAVAYALMHSVASWRGNRYRAELRRRYGGGDWFAQELMCAAKAFRADDPPDWLLVLRAAALPHGGRIAVDLEIWAGSGKATVRRTPFSGGRKIPPGTAVSRELTPDEKNFWSEWIAGPAPAALHDVRHFAYDGVPCSVAALRREPFTVVRATCNVAGLPPEQAALPAAVLAARLLALAGTIAPSPGHNVGWCDASGNIGIGRQ